MNKDKSNYSKLIKSQKDIHNAQVDEIINDTDNNKQRIAEFKLTKKMKWWHYLISVSVAVFFTGLAFLIGYLARNSAKAPSYQASGWTSLIVAVLLLVAFLIIGWVKNNNAKNYFHDKRRRYQHTFSIEEAKLILTNKIVFLAFFLMIPVVLATNICFN